VVYISGRRNAVSFPYRLFIPRKVWEMAFNLPPLNVRSGFDMRTVWALRMVGVNLTEHLWSSGRRKDHVIRFTFHGDREMAKGVIEDFISDEFNGTNCRFYAVNSNPRDCYVLFDEGKVTKCEPI
jgi:hypothetical protein